MVIVQQVREPRVRIKAADRPPQTPPLASSRETGTGEHRRNGTTANDYRISLFLVDQSIIQNIVSHSFVIISTHRLGITRQMRRVCFFSSIVLLIAISDGFKLCSNRLYSKYHKVNCNSPYDPAVMITSESGIALRMYNQYEEENKGFSLKILGVLVIAGVGIFGSDLFGSATMALRSATDPANSVQQDSSSGLKQTNSNRGSLTRLTRREINEKLAQVPVFFATTDSKNGAIFVDTDSIGKIFFDKIDADAYASKQKLQVGATTLDDVFFTLIEKKQKLGNFIEGVAGKSNPDATYIMQSGTSQRSQVSPEWLASHNENDIPLFRINNLAFQKENGLEIPLFTQREDALVAYSRLQESKKSDNPKSVEVESTTPNVQTTSLLDLVKLLGVGGFEGRSLEIYPSIDAIQSARDLIL